MIWHAKPCFGKPSILSGYSIQLREVKKPNRASRTRYRTATVIVETDGVIWLIAVSAVIEMLANFQTRAQYPPPNYLIQNILQITTIEIN